MILDTLTPLELEILRDRLELSDCLVDVLGAEVTEPDDIGGYHPDDIEHVAALLLAGDEQGANDHSEALTRDMIIDCVDGSTYYVGHDDGMTKPQKLSAIQRAGESLANKVGEHYERRVVFPLY